MKKREYYHRISISLPPGTQSIKNDQWVDDAFYISIDNWADRMSKTNPNFEYRITNADHITLPNPAIGPGQPSVMIAINIAYTI